ncbi:MAG TPA: hypothetical protein VMW75_11655, partial [Thermoanaerobaculia bacterium]|nr:hypothetical protein [Thermoanaerobaculia bacterium]
MNGGSEQPAGVVDDAAAKRVDAINRSFYNRFTFPPPPPSFERIEDPYFEVQMLNQSIGGWCGDRVPRRPRIWVAGCGKYQALQTALRFPAGDVVATDVA